MWLIEALKHDHDVTVVTTGGWNLAALNAFYGTNVGADEVKVRIAPFPALARRMSMAALRGACYQRFARKIAGDYDLRISAYNLTDWGMPAVHFIADFSWHRSIRERLDPPTPGFFYRDSLLRRSYLRGAARFASPSGRSVLRDDLLIANSQWTRNLIKQSCDVECQAVVYPSVWTEFPAVPWEKKELAFAMIGRISPEKQIERAITILQGVRERGHAVRLHLCGQIENDKYGRRIAQLCRDRADWIIPEGRVSGARKAQILAACKFGIQTREAEPFGISVAEMIKAGSIVFAPNDGGQAEVLQRPELLFSTVDEAVDKICATLSNPEQQETLRAMLRQRAGDFSSEKFIQSARVHLVRKPPVHAGVPAFLRQFRKVVIGHPMLGFGGSEAIVMWLIEALHRDYDVTVATTGGWNLDALNAFYGTRIKEGDVHVRIASFPFPVKNMKAAALRGNWYQRFARRIAADYDLRISAYNPTDWGLPAIHFIADFSWHLPIRERIDPPTPGFIYRDSLLRRAYLKFAAAYGSPSGRNVLKDDVVIANSHWTANLMKEACGVDCTSVIYPPVWEQFPAVEWEDKRPSFVMIGRIAPEKQVEKVIAILEQVRQRGHAVGLHLCGKIENDTYGRSIARLCNDRADWIIAEGRVSGARKTEILSRSRFGIQSRGAEPFGISVAEMVKAGAIVFAPNDGGQAEVLGHQGLLFDSATDAVKKICAAIAIPSLQLELRGHLRRLGFKYNTDDFVRASQELVDHSLSREWERKRHNV
jgi:glycosyltransferase involved in cell wall biosynthesis